ncbi:MAG: hypothetical protein ABFS34_16285, partial [Gemmatimonadota bacterium]
MTDGALVARYLRSRREKDFLAFYRRCEDALWRLALRLARGEEDDATDIFQETWFRATARLT